MKAIRIHHTGGPEVLQLEDVELAPPAPGQARVRHTAIGVNFIDTYHRSGLYKLPLPSGLGSEAAGVVEALGDGVTTLKPGDRVAYAGALGAYAQENNVPADKLVKLPDGVSHETAAAAMLKGMTVQYLLKRTYPVQPGQTILFHAAAGGVGLIAGQWAKHLGATVIGTVGSDEKIALAGAHGYAHVLNLQSEDWVKRVREITGGTGVPVVYDSIGKDTWSGSLDCLAVRGMMVSFGNSSGAAPRVRAEPVEREGLALRHASDANPLHPRRPRAAGDRRRPLRCDRLRRGEGGGAPALQLGGRRQSARSAAFPQHDRRDDPFAMSPPSP